MVRLRRFLVLLALVSLVLVIGIPLVGALHPEGGSSQLHDDTATAHDVTGGLYLHCGESECTDDSERWMDSDRLGSDETQDTLSTDATTYTFSELSQGMDYRTQKSFELHSVDATLRLEWRGDQDRTVTVRLLEVDGDGSDELGSGQISLPANESLQAATKSVTIISEAASSVTVDSGHNLQVEVVLDERGESELPGVLDEYNLVLDSSEEPTRLELDGPILQSYVWTMDKNSKPTTTFPLDGPEEDRHVDATLVLDSLLGRDLVDEDSLQLRARFDNEPVDLQPDNDSTDVLPYALNDKTSHSRVVYTLEESWSYAEDREPGSYRMIHEFDTAPPEPDFSEELEENTHLTLGAGVDASFVGPSAREVVTGENASFPLNLTNVATGEVNLDIRTPSPATDWVAFSQPTKLALTEESSERITVKVRPPASASPGTEETVTVRLVPTNRIEIDPIEVNVTVEVVDEVRLEPGLQLAGDPPDEIAPGGDRTIEVEVVNNGTVRDTLFVQRGDLPAGWTASFSETSFALDPGERREFEVTVTAGENEETDTNRTVPIRAQSSRDAQVVTELEIDLTVGVLIRYDVDIHGRVRRVFEDDSDAVTWRVIVENKGNVEETFDVSVNVDASNGTRGALTLRPGQMGQITRVVGNSSEQFCREFSASESTTPKVIVEPEQDPSMSRSFELIGFCNVPFGEGLIRGEIEPMTDPDRDGHIEVKRRARAEPGDFVEFPVRLSSTGYGDPFEEGEDFGEIKWATSAVPPGEGWKAEITGRGIADTDTLAKPVTFKHWNEHNNPNEFRSCEAYCVSGTLEVRVPEDAEAGRHEITVVAVSQTANTRTFTFDYVVEIGEERGVSIRAADPSLEANPGSEAVFNVVAENTGNVRETIDLSVATTGLPGDWSLRSGPSELELPPSAQRVFTVKVLPSDDASAGDAGTVNLSMTTAFGEDTDLLLETTVVDAAGIGLSSSRPQGAVLPGETIPFEVEVTNEGQSATDVQLSTAAVPFDYDVTVEQDGTETTRLEVDGGASEKIQVRLSVPEGAAGLIGTVLYAGTPGSDARTALGLNATITETEGVGLTPRDTSKVIPAGDSGTFRLTVTNEGTGTDTITLCVLQFESGDQPDCNESVSADGWSSSVGVDALKLGPQESRQTTITVTPSAGISPGVSHETIIVATSAEDPTTGASTRVNATTLLRDIKFASSDVRRAAAPGETIQVDVPVENAGNADDRIAVDVLDTPDGWNATAGSPTDAGPGDVTTIPVTVETPGTATRGVYGIGVQARSLFAADVAGELVASVRIADHRSRDVDDDGFDEFAVDRNDRSEDGLEEFTEVTTAAGLETEVVVADRFGETVRSGFVLKVQDAPETRHRFWSPDTESLTDVVTGRILGPSSLGYFVDVDDDGSVDFMYDEGSERVLDAVSVQDRDAFLVDSDEDGTMDIYYNNDRGIATETRDQGGDSVAADSDDDGSFDVVVDQSDGSTRAFTAADAAVYTGATYGYVYALVAGVVILSMVAYIVRVKGEDL